MEQPYLTRECCYYRTKSRVVILTDILLSGTIKHATISNTAVCMLLLSQHLKRKDFVVAIDFGTYGTSFAIAHKGKFVGTYPTQRGQDRSKPYLKFETKLLYEKNKAEPIKWVWRCYLNI